MEELRLVIIAISEQRSPWKGIWKLLQDKVLRKLDIKELAHFWLFCPFRLECKDKILVEAKMIKYWLIYSCHCNQSSKLFPLSHTTCIQFCYSCQSNGRGCEILNFDVRANQVNRIIKIFLCFNILFLFSQILSKLFSRWHYYSNLKNHTSELQNCCKILNGTNHFE